MSEILIVIAIIIALILLNGVFVAAEFAIIGAPRTAIEKLAERGHSAARLVKSVLNDARSQDRTIATAQLGITFTSLGLGMYGEHMMAHWIEDGLNRASWDLSPVGSFIAAHALATVLAIGVLTYFHIVVGEMVPKSLALMHAERTVLGVIRPLLLFRGLIWPLVLALNGLGNGILRLFGVRRQIASGNFHTPEELEYIVQESQVGGLLRAEEGQVLRDLFAFGERTAREVMVPRVRVDGIELGSSPAELGRILSASRRTRYPVYEENLDHIVGVVHIKDVLRLLRSNTSLERQHARDTAFVPETAELDNVLEVMRRARSQLLVVMDEHGGTAGIITIEDLCEEVVGEVEEGNEPLREVVAEAPGVVRVDGVLRLDEVGELLDRVLEHPEVDTVSGLVLTSLGRPPRVGDTIEYEGVRFEVTATEGHGVAQALAKIIEA